MALPVNPAVLTRDLNVPTFIAPPWTPDQVENLNRRQEASLTHPFTCGQREHHYGDPGVLVADVDGWHCPVEDCGYRQTWAHPFMDQPLTAREAQRVRDRQRIRELAALPRPCLLHEDVHADHGVECYRSFAAWRSARPHLVGKAARDAYALAVEQRLLDQLVRQHAPARRTNPALSK
ncbi:hypothetical protein ACIA7S_28545 [Streptomyces sp. NPDC051643]|uniref:hypothetical protein n=1 Tax=Streptomyces sp. NPDC051643 TaxID=3365665 RepID=UPI0037914FA3